MERVEPAKIEVAAIYHIDGSGLRHESDRALQYRPFCRRNMPLLVIDGQEVSWDEFGRMLMSFEGRQFRVAIREPERGGCRAAGRLNEKQAPRSSTGSPSPSCRLPRTSTPSSSDKGDAILRQTAADLIGTPLLLASVSPHQLHQVRRHLRGCPEASCVSARPLLRFPLKR